MVGANGPGAFGTLTLIRTCLVFPAATCANSTSSRLQPLPAHRAGILNVITLNQEGQMTLDELKALKESGEFHHATYRNFGTLHEGLWIYRRTPGFLRGFDVAGAFL